jgi:subtilisin family serine protease
MKKKGSVGVIGILLILLICVVISIIVLNVFYRYIFNNAETVKIDSLLLDGNIVSAELNESKNVFTIVFKRGNKGGNISGIKFVFEDTNGYSYSNRSQIESFSELETRETKIRLNNLDSELENFSKIRKIYLLYYYKENNFEKLSRIIDIKTIGSSNLAGGGSPEGSSGGSGGGGSGGDGGDCVPKNCFDINKECGNWDDGCENNLTCGSCTGYNECIDGKCVRSCRSFDDPLCNLSENFFYCNSSTDFCYGCKNLFPDVYYKCMIETNSSSDKYGCYVSEDIALCNLVQTCDPFNGCVNFFISIATLKDYYTTIDQINITDPPSENQKNVDDLLNLGEDYNNSIYSFDKPPISEELNYKGYIIEFEKPSIIQKSLELNKIAYENNQIINVMSKFNPYRYIYEFFSLTEKKVPKKLERYRNELNSGNNAIKKKIMKNLDKRKLVSMSKTSSIDLKVLNEFEDAFNGIVLNINTEEAKSIEKIPGIKRVSPNYEVKTTLLDSVPLINADDLWAIDNSSNNCLLSGNTCLNGEGITIAIIDTGIDYTHSDLGNCTTEEFLTGNCKKVIDGYDFFNNDSDPIDDNMHGTHVAGIAAGNGSLLKGVAPGAKLVAYKVLSSSGSGNFDDIIAAIERSVDPNQDGNYSDHLDIISLSLGALCSTINYACGPNDPPSTAINRAIDLGVIAVIAAGNKYYYYTINTPGMTRNAITVAATYKKNYTGNYWDVNPRVDYVTAFSSRGPVRIYDESREIYLKPDLSAPGAIICSARYDSVFPNGSHPYYKPCIDENHVEIAGTSMAAPVVSGAAALLKQARPDWGPREIKLSLENTAVFNPNEEIYEQGFGRIDVFKAFNLKSKPIFINIDWLGEVSGLINFTGTIKGENFSNYTVYYGQDFYPNNWIELYTGYSEVINNTIATIDTSSMLESSNNGYNLIKVVAYNAYGEKYEEQRFILVNNFHRIFPQNNDLVRAGGTIEIRGSIMHHNLINYTIEYARGLGLDFSGNEFVWQKTGILLANNGEQNVYKNVLGYWNTSNIKTPDFYTLRFTINTMNNTYVRYVQKFWLDPRVKFGWPVYNDFRFYYQGVERHLSPVAEDLDNDNIKEIITLDLSGYDQYYPNLTVYNPNGSIKWSLAVPYKAGLYSNVLVGDLNNDSYKEIVLYLEGTNPYYIDQNPLEIFAIYHNGTVVNGFPVKKGSFQNSGSLVEDVDNDGNDDILYITYAWNPSSPQMRILNFSGHATHEFNLLFHFNAVNNHQAFFSVGNFDFEPNLEIVAPVKPCYSCNNFTVQVLKLDGQVIFSTPTIYNETIYRSIVLGDIDNNSDLEIIFTTSSNDFRYGNLHVYHSNGTFYSGFPKRFIYGTFSTPALGDLDNDGNLEIVFTDRAANLYVYNISGKLQKGFPVTRNTYFNSIYSPGIADIDQDGYADIILTGGGIQPALLQAGAPYFESSGGLRVWNRFGKRIDLNPVYINSSTLFSEIWSIYGPVITDLDNNKKMDIVFTNTPPKAFCGNRQYDPNCESYTKRLDNINVIELNVPYTKENIHWPRLQYDSGYSGKYEKPMQRPESKIVNYENNNITGNLLLKLQYKNNDFWSDSLVCYNNTVSIPANGLLKLDNGLDNLNNFVFNGWNNCNIYANVPGNYRVFAEFLRKNSTWEIFVENYECERFCDDMNSCTIDSCNNNECSRTNILSCNNNDGCCLEICNFTNDNDCQCIPDCEGKICGDDGCYGSCGSCSSGTQCVNFTCENIYCIDYDVTLDYPDGKNYFNNSYIETNKISWNNINYDVCSIKMSDSLSVNNLSCSGNNCSLTEYYCNTNQPYSININCPSLNCYNGSCIS